MIVRARAPLRLGIAGGGTDVSPYCDNHGGVVLNAAINRYAYVVIESLSEDRVEFCAADQQVAVSQCGTLFPTRQVGLPLHQAVYNYVIDNFNDGKGVPLRISTFCEAPPGSGLGSSSTLMVAMVKAFAEFFMLPLDDHRIASIAFHVERDICGLQGGRQDQYAAAFGGFNFIEFYAEGRTVVNPLRIKNWIVCELEASILLYFTGVSRHSSEIIAEQSSNVKQGDTKTTDALHALKREAVVIKERLLVGDFSGICSSLNKAWENKKLSAKSVSNSEIDRIFDGARDAGAAAGKVSGAGGGGFMWFFVPNDRRMRVVRTLEGFGGVVSGCSFSDSGCQAWRIS